MAEPAPALSAVRAMYHRLGIDPTRTRPSSEALWRRIRKGDRLPAINAPVDVANWCSVETQLPFGLYDLDGLRGPIALRRGRAGEAYAGIRKDVVHVEGRMTLADDDGPFGNPTSDSARTMVTRGTRRVMVVIFAPAACEIGVLDHALTLTASRMQAHAGAVETARFVVDAGGRGSGVTEE
jgi:DNA/RNA-binding domain of Phe-tRNA-synthetase-like protein